MPKYFLIYQMFILSTAITLLGGCSVSTPTPTFEQMDNSPFTGIPCAAPCWYGLSIGESNEKDVLAVLPTLTFIDQNTIRSFRPSMPNLEFSAFAPGVEFVADCVYPTKRQCLSVIVVDNILTDIELALNYDISVDEVIETLGDPDYIGYRNLGAERIICKVNLIWSSRQLVLASRFEGYKATEDTCGVVRNTGKISPSLFVSEVRYVSLVKINRILSSNTNEFF
jgi:hypothetical protein